MTSRIGFFDPRPYIPASLSELYDQIGSMILGAPTFKDQLEEFNWSLDSEFNKLFQGFALVRNKLGEERFAKLNDLATRAKALFADDQDDTNGKTDQGRALLFEMEDVLNEARRARVEAKLPDDDGEITGD